MKCSKCGKKQNCYKVRTKIIGKILIRTRQYNCQCGHNWTKKKAIYLKEVYNKNTL